MDSPFAWIPSTAAAQRLRDLARSLRVFSEGKPLVQTLAGPRLITAPPPETINNFPIKYNDQTGVATVPGIYVDFVTWQYLAPQTIGGGPVGTTGDKWLRLKLDVSFDPMPDFWTTVSIGAPTLEWVDTEGATPTPSFMANFFPNHDGSIYYRYIARVYNPEEPEQTQVNKLVLQSTLSAGIVQGFPF